MAAGDLLRTIANPAPVGGARFGYSVALNDDTLLVGAPNGWGTRGGQAYGFNPATGSRTLSVPGTGNPSFGYPTAGNDDWFAVGDYSGNVKVVDAHTNVVTRTLRSPDISSALVARWPSPATC